MGSRLQQPMTALNADQPRQQAQQQAWMQQIGLAAGQRPPRQALSLVSLVCMLLPSAQAMHLAPAGRSVSARRLPDSHSSPLRAAMLGPLPSNWEAWLIAAAQHLQSCQPRSRIPAVLREQTHLPRMLSCRLPGAFCLRPQRLCPGLLQAKAGGRERGSLTGQRRFQQAVCTQLQGCLVECAWG